MKLILKVKRIRDDINEPRKRTSGITTGLAMFDFIAAVFAANEVLTTKRKLTDATIREEIIKEYPNEKSVQQLIKNKITISYYRTMYNRGQMTHGRLPRKQSIRWTYQGKEFGYPKGGRKKKERDYKIKRSDIISSETYPQQKGLSDAKKET